MRRSKAESECPMNAASKGVSGKTFMVTLGKPTIEIKRGIYVSQISEYTYCARNIAHEMVMSAMGATNVDTFECTV